MKPLKQAVYPSSIADKFVMRLPDGMRARVHEKANANHRSMNSQLISYVEACLKLEDEGSFDLLETLTNWDNAEPNGSIIQAVVPAFHPHVGDPVMFDDKAWILRDYRIMADGKVWALIDRGNDKSVSYWDSTAVLPSDLSPYVA